MRWPSMLEILAHVLIGKPVPTPDQVRGRLFPGHALAVMVRHNHY
jgi:hypothetical protein